MRKGLPVLVGVLAAAVLLLAPCSALAVAISPGVIQGENVMRGRELVRSLTIYNTQASAQTYTFLARNKPISAWIAVLDPKTNKGIASLDVPAKSSASVSVVVKVPATAANGRYTGFLDAVPTTSTQASGAVLIPSLTVKISVTDKEIIDMRFQSLDVGDAEEGMPLDINLVVRNQSNVDIAPTLLFGVAQGDAVLRRAEFDMANLGVDMAGSEVFNLELKNLKVGKYRAYGQLKYHDGLTEKRSVDFAVVPRGTFSKAALENFRISGPRRVGGTLTLEATFSSKSPKALKPRLVADVYRDGLKIGSVESGERAVDPYREVVVTAPLKLQEAGSYKIEGYFVYAGAKSNRETVSFDVANNRTAYAFGATALFALVMGSMYYRRRRANGGWRDVFGRRRPQDGAVSGAKPSGTHEDADHDA